MFSNIEIGTRISSARNMKCLTLEEVASKVGVAKTTIMRYEKGTISKIKLPVIESIAHALDVDPNWLIGNTDTPFMSSFSPAQELTSEETELLQNYQSINKEGQKKLLDYSRDLLSSGNYQKTSSVSVG